MSRQMWTIIISKLHLIFAVVIHSLQNSTFVGTKVSHFGTYLCQSSMMRCYIEYLILTIRNILSIGWIPAMSLSGVYFLSLIANFWGRPYIFGQDNWLVGGRYLKKENIWFVEEKEKEEGELRRKKRTIFTWRKRVNTMQTNKYLEDQSSNTCASHEIEDNCAQLKSWAGWHNLWGYRWT